MTPGPTPVPPQVLAALALPIVHHRSPDFRPTYQEVLERLKEVYRTSNEVLLYTASGTAGLESVVANLTSPGDRVVAVSAGYFGERWAEIATAYGCEVEHLAYEWGENPSADDLTKRLAELGGASAVLVTQSETSTGVVCLDVAVGLILERGLEAAFAEHVRLGRACREGVKAMGLELFSPDDDSSAVVTTVRVPDSVDGSRLLLDLRDRFGITLAPGQGPLKGKVFRVGHLGYYDVFDITTALAGIELALAEAGADIDRGVAVTPPLEPY